MRITIQFHFENLSIFFKKANAFKTLTVEETDENLVLFRKNKMR